MSSAPREEEIFLAARDLNPEERPAYLAAACGNHRELRRAVEELLESETCSTRFLAEPAPLVEKARTALGEALEKPGDRIGSYVLLERIGEGGSGVVYLAQQEEPIRRRVALKILRLGMNSESVVARFEAERQAIARMDHPNIAKVLDAGATGSGRPFFVMELVEGQPITTFCDAHGLSIRQRLELFIQVCRAVQHAHQKGIIHRDLKPSNVLVALQDGIAVPKVIDFGIAKAIQGRLGAVTVFTSLHQLIGTPAYMSPEQLDLKDQDVDTRADVYSLGVLLYELLTGRTPFANEHLLEKGLEHLRRTIVDSEPERPSGLLRQFSELDLQSAARKRGSTPTRLVHSIEGDVDWITMKCLEKMRSRRYETANGLAADLERYLKDQPVIARPPSNWYQFERFVRRHRAGVAGGSVALAGVVVAAIVLVVSYHRAIREQIQRESALQAARQSESDARNQLFHALRSEAQARRYSGQMGQSTESLAALKRAAAMSRDTTLRDEIIASLALPDIVKGPRWRATSPRTKAVAFDSDYSRYARVDEPGIVTILRTGDGAELQRLSSEAQPIPCARGCAVLFSRDGKLLALRDSQLHLHLWRLSPEASVHIDELPPVWVMAFNRDGHRLALGCSRSIVIVDPRTGEVLSRWATPAQAYRIAYSPDDLKLAVGYAEYPEVDVFNSRDGASMAALPVANSSHEIVAWHPDSDLLAVSGSDPRVALWRVSTATPVGRLEGNAQQTTFLSFHPGGELIATDGWEGVVRLWEPSSKRQVLHIPFGIQVGFSKSGEWLGISWEQDARDAQLLEARPSRQYHTFAAHQTNSLGILYQGDISPDGQILAMGMDDGVHLFAVATRRELASMWLGSTLSVHFVKAGTELLTCGPEAGLRQWSIEKHGDGLVIGPPQTEGLASIVMRVTPAVGSLAAVISEESQTVQLFDLNLHQATGPPMHHDRVSVAALTRNGKRMATAGWHSDVVRLWDTSSGTVMHEWQLRGPLNVTFTSDDRNLVICRDAAFDFIDLDSLRCIKSLPRDMEVYPGPVAFSPDGKLMALELTPGTLCLEEVSTARLIAKLQDPFGDRATWMQFTPDGTQLLTAARYAGAMHAWDLQALRAELIPLGLDWDWPGFQTSTNAMQSVARTPVQLEVSFAGLDSK